MRVASGDVAICPPLRHARESPPWANSNGAGIQSFSSADAVLSGVEGSAPICADSQARTSDTYLITQRLWQQDCWQERVSRQLVACGSFANHCDSSYLRKSPGKCVGFVRFQKEILVGKTTELSFDGSEETTDLLLVASSRLMDSDKAFMEMNLR